MTNVRGVLMDAADTASSQDAVLSDGAVVRCDFSGPDGAHVATATFTRAGLEESDDREVALTLEDIWNTASADNALNAEFESAKAQVIEAGYTDASFAAHGNEMEYVWTYDENVHYVDSASANEALRGEQVVTEMVNIIAAMQRELDEDKTGITGITCLASIQNTSGEVVGSCRYGIDGVVE